MTETFYRTGLHKIDHTTFGGLIHFSDFSTNYRGSENINGSSIANRIVADWEFDKKCRQNGEDKNTNKTWRKKRHD